jgi:putative acetyltransferase
MTTIRREKKKDSHAIRLVHEKAFGQSDEANIVKALQRRGAITVSLAAIQDNQVVGHILFSPVTIESKQARFNAAGLGPMAVLPRYQRRGIGSQLVQAGLEQCRTQGIDIVVVIGHPRFYPRFGFAPARSHGIVCEFEVPDDVFMVAELRQGALTGREGIARYQREFTSI